MSHRHHRRTSSTPQKMSFPGLGEGKLLGKGTHSRVYKVTRNDGSHIVLKRFLNEEELSELAEKCNDSLDVFRTYYPENMELEKAAMEEAMRLQVPHMCHYYGFYEDGGVKGFLLEYYEAETLDSFRKGKKKYSLRQVQVIVREILEYLAKLHLKYIHRDIKPDNILVGREGIIVVDLGTAAETNRPDQKKLGGYTAPDFGAPETFGTKPYPDRGVTEWFDAKADIFAAGAIMYLLLKGKALFLHRKIRENVGNDRAAIGKEIIKIVKSVKQDKPRKVSEKAWDLMLGMLDPEPETRLTAAECLRHGWFTVRESDKDVFGSSTVSFEKANCVMS